MVSAEIKSVLEGLRHRRQSWGLEVSRPPDFGLGGSWGSQGRRGRGVKHYYILSCTGSMLERGDFQAK